MLREQIGLPVVGLVSIGRLITVASALVVAVALVVVGVFFWNESRLDLRVDEPVFSDQIGALDCVSGLVAVLEDIGIEAPVREDGTGCSTSFEHSSGQDLAPWVYSIRVEHEDFDNETGHYRSLGDSRGIEECSVVPFTGGGKSSEYIEGHGGFCVFNDAIADYRDSRAMTSRLVFARFGRQVDVELSIQLEPGSAYAGPALALPLDERDYLLHQIATVFSVQLDPTGAVDDQLQRFAPRTVADPVWSEGDEDSWCAAIAVVDVGGIANGIDSGSEGYEAEIVEDGSGWWDRGRPGEIHCSTTWSLATWAGDGLDYVNPYTGLAVSLTVTPWPWGPEGLEDDGFRNSYRGCEAIDLEAIGSAPSQTAEAAERVESPQRCDVMQRQSVVMFVLDDTHLVRIQAYDWDFEGHSGGIPELDALVQEAALEAFLVRLAESD